jgi:hypothetical protein
MQNQALKIFPKKMQTSNPSIQTTAKEKEKEQQQAMLNTPTPVRSCFIPKEELMVGHENRPVIQATVDTFTQLFRQGGEVIAKSNRRIQGVTLSLFKKRIKKSTLS